MKTRAAVLVEIKKPLVIEELEIPPLQPGQCLVRIRSAGVCRTQLSEQQGLKGDDPYLPHLLGHEASGVIEQVGPEVTKVAVDDYVVISWLKGKGADVGGGQYVAKGGEKVNSGGAAVFTEYAIVSENRITAIPREVPPGVAALLGCAVPTGVGVVLNTLAMRKGQSIAVFGVGGVGGAAILGAKLVGCKPIIAVDVVEKKLRLAQALGATHTISNVKGESATEIRTLLPDGIDAAVEATGLPHVAEQAFGVLGKKGRLAIAGHPAQGSRISLDPFMFIEGRSIVGTWGGDVTTDQDIPRFAQLFLEGALPIDRLITHTYRLDEINEALRLVEHGEAGRVVIVIHD